jgi:hypothetical protein
MERTRLTCKSVNYNLKKSFVKFNSDVPFIVGFTSEEGLVSQGILLKTDKSLSTDKLLILNKCFKAQGF